MVLNCYTQVAGHLLVTYAPYDITTESDNDIVRPIEPSGISSLAFTEARWRKMLRCLLEYDE